MWPSLLCQAALLRDFLGEALIAAHADRRAALAKLMQSPAVGMVDMEAQAHLDAYEQAVSGAGIVLWPVIFGGLAHVVACALFIRMNGVAR